MLMTGQVHANGIRGRLPFKGLYFRDFGWWADDLQADFDQADRPGLVTQILRDCTFNQEGLHPSEDLFWESSVGKRIQCLLTIALSGQMQALCRMQCTAQGCGEPMEIEMDLAELGRLQQEADATDCIMIEAEHGKIKLRKPRGIDQQRWLKQSYRTEQEVMASIVETLLCDNAAMSQAKTDLITDDLIHAANDVMKTADPLINMAFSVCCPNCGTRAEYPFNLEAYALKKLRRAQTDLIQMIHSLARHYKWTESEILAIPPRRRAQYLALIERGDARS